MKEDETDFRRKESWQEDEISADKLAIKEDGASGSE